MKFSTLTGLLFLICLQSTFSQETRKRVAVFIDLPDSITHSNRGLTVFHNFEKNFSQTESLLDSVNQLVQQELQKLDPFDITVSQDSLTDLKQRLKNNDWDLLANYDLLFLISGSGFYYSSPVSTATHRYKGHGIFTNGLGKSAMLYGDYLVTIVDVDKNRSISYNTQSYRKSAYTKKLADQVYLQKYFLPKEKIKNISTEKIADIERKLLSMYTIKTTILFNDKQFQKAYNKLLKMKARD